MGTLDGSKMFLCERILENTDFANPRFKLYTFNSYLLAYQYEIQISTNETKMIGVKESDHKMVKLMCRIFSQRMLKLNFRSFEDAFTF